MMKSTKSISNFKNFYNYLENNFYALSSLPLSEISKISLFRALLCTLREADLIICEDTRHSGNLLKHFEISKPLQSFHSHSTWEQAKNS